MSDETPAIEAPTEVAPDNQSREALIAAADAATETPADPAAKPETPAAKVDPEKPAEDDGLSTVAKVLKQREAAHAAREDASRAKAEAEAARAEVAAMRAEAERDRAAAKTERERLEKLRATPMAAIKELGWDTKQLVDEVTREGTPEWQAQKRYEAALAEQSRELAEMKAWREEQAKAAQAQTQQQQAYAKQQVEARFLSIFPAESAARALYDEAELVTKGNAIADAYREKSGGKVATLEEVRDYLEEQAAKRLAVIRHQPGEVTGSKAPAAAAKVATNRANGPRALSGNAASERRASPKPHHEMTEAEQRQAQIDAANAAIGR